MLSILPENFALSVFMARKDKVHLENFIKALDSNYKIHNSVSHGYPVCSVYIYSEKICADLKNNFKNHCKIREK